MKRLRAIWRFLRGWWLVYEWDRYENWIAYSSHGNGRHA